MTEKKSIHQMGGEAVVKKYGKKHMKALADKRWKNYRKNKKKK
jgi:transcription initiation factor TFIIIB Brf1 subunit/transcription initiation factor TFIIB